PVFIIISRSPKIFLHIGICAGLKKKVERTGEIDSIENMKTVKGFNKIDVPCEWFAELNPPKPPGGIIIIFAAGIAEIISRIGIDDKNRISFKHGAGIIKRSGEIHSDEFSFAMLIKNQMINMVVCRIGFTKVRMKIP